NPPYVGGSPNSATAALYETADCGDLYAWIFERALQHLDKTGTCGVIVPLSLTFSSRIAPLRELLRRSGRSCRLASFDNIPDCIFNTGKSSDNTSKSNSQRATIAIVQSSPNLEARVHSTSFLRWTADERPLLLSNLRFADVTNYVSVQGIPKIGDDRLAHF